MDSSLDEIIASRPKGRGGGAGGRRPDRRPQQARTSRREDFPRDGVKKYRRDDHANLDSEWMHDRFEDDRHDRVNRRPPVEGDRSAPPRDAAPSGPRIRVDNLHYELTEDDLRELFERIGPVASVRLLYDRADRSEGVAFVIYEDHRDARQAVANFDGCNANGQPIRLTMMANSQNAGPSAKGSLLDRIERPPRSLLDRIEGGPEKRGDSRDGRTRRQRSDSPRRNRPTPSNIDRYVPGTGSRSPIRRRGTPRESGRRPGAGREGSGRGGNRSRAETGGRQVVGGRPRKTAEELDAEMADYWGKPDEAPAGNGASENAKPNGAGITAPVTDIDMDIIE